MNLIERRPLLFWKSDNLNIPEWHDLAYSVQTSRSVDCPWQIYRAMMEEVRDGLDAQKWFLS